MPFFEVGGAVLSSLIISPLMTCIDVSIIQSQLNKISFWDSFKKTNIQFYNGQLPFLRPCGIMNLVYSSTFLTANMTEYVYRKKNTHEEVLKTQILINTSLVNMLAISYKDAQYARLFQNKAYANIPFSSLALFGVRDILTIGSSFVMKRDVNRFLKEEFNLRPNFADFVSSFVLPISAQIFSTPLHILAIDFIHNQDKKVLDRMKEIQKLYWRVCIGRMARVIPAFGVGGFLNDMIRKQD